MNKAIRNYSNGHSFKGCYVQNKIIYPFLVQLIIAVCDDLSGRLINFAVGPLFQLRVVHPMWCCLWKICHLIFQMPSPRLPSWDLVSSLFSICNSNWNLCWSILHLLRGFSFFAFAGSHVEGSPFNVLLPTQLFNH